VDIVAKLQIKPGQLVAVLTATAETPAVTTDDLNPPAAADDADVTVAFVRVRAELATVAVPAIEAARRDQLAWIAYPKAGKLGTDLNRDTLAAALVGEGIQPVRQVAIDETWSALRFRPA
jgi:phage-related baseplate assembly protein